MFSKIKDYLPYGQTLTCKQAQSFLKLNQDPIKYLDHKLISFKVIPFQVFAFHYDEDIVVETNHPELTMQEIAKVKIDGQTMWIAKDSSKDGVQTITSNNEAVLNWSPEIAVPRRIAPLNVIDNSTDDKVDVKISYINQLDEQVELEFSCPKPSKENFKGNGSTFDHSHKVVSALLDISKKQLSNVKAKVTFNNKNFGIRKILDLIPVKALLTQTQAGFAIASYTQKLDKNELKVKRPVKNHIWPTKSSETWLIESDVVCFQSGESNYQYQFNKNNELVGVKVISSRGITLMELKLSAPLPNFNHPFSDAINRNFIVEVNGKIQGHGIIKSQFVESGFSIEINPEKPYWFRQRPIEIRLEIDGQTKEVHHQSNINYSPQ